MDQTLALPNDAVNSNRCCLCGNILSVPPIMIISSDSELYKCGRCKQVECKAYARLTLFENVAKFLSFPCTYQNCNQTVPWVEVEAHEKLCSHRTVRCPIYYQQCEDDVVVANIYSHFKEKHKANIKTPGKVWSLNVGYDYIYLLKVKDLHFFVYILHLNSMFSVGLFALEPTDKYRKFNVRLSSGGENEFFVAYENQTILPYDERQHCYKCLRKLCSLKHHPYSKENKKEEMNLETFTKKFNKDLLTMLSGKEGDIQYTMSLTDSEKHGQPSESRENSSNSTAETESVPSPDKVTLQSKDELFRKSFECPVCTEYLVSPIYTCSTGHTICNVCRPRLKKCPVCEAVLGDTRNFTLELMTENTELYCQYHENGCTFTGVTAKLHKHEAECDHKQ